VGRRVAASHPTLHWEDETARGETKKKKKQKGQFACPCKKEGVGKEARCSSKKRALYMEATSDEDQPGIAAVSSPEIDLPCAWEGEALISPLTGTERGEGEV